MTPKQRRFYVYRLVDPRDGAPFYVGKGTGRRAHVHVAAVRRGKIDNGLKCQRISEILSAGLEVVVETIKDRLTEQDAFVLERRLIAEGVGLTNIARGVVSEAESRAASIAMNIAAIKPFEVWVRTASEETLALIRRVFGGPEEFYRWYRDAWERLARDLQQPRDVA